MTWHKTIVRCVNFDLVSDFDRHQVFAQHKWAGISLPCVRNYVGDIGWNDVRVDRQLRFDKAEDRSGLFGGGVMADNFLRLLAGIEAAGFLVILNINDLMNQNIGALRELDEIVGRPRIPRHGDGVPGIINPVTVRRLDFAVVDQEGGDLHAVVAIDHPFLNVMSDDFCACPRQLGVHIAADMNIESISLLQVFHHRLGPLRSPYRKRFVTPHYPAREPEVGDPDRVIGVQMGEEQSGDVVERNIELVDSLGYAAPAIEDELLMAGFHQCAWPEAREHRTGIARAEQGHFDLLGVSGYCQENQTAENAKDAENSPVSPVPSVFMNLTHGQCVTAAGWFSIASMIESANSDVPAFPPTSRVSFSRVR